MHFLGTIFSYILEKCYALTNSYLGAIAIFTFLTKIILMPLSVMVHKNSIKMVKLYPELNRIKIKYFGSKDLISEEEYNLYKKEHYHPTLDLIPIIFQLFILMGVVEGIRLIEVPNKMFLSVDMGIVPSKVLGIYILIPILAALSAWLMCYTQNVSNVLQSEQNKLNQISTLAISVGLSLYLGFFVECGIGSYWILSNLMSIGTMYLLNYLINPKRYIDYDELFKTKSELEQLTRYMKPDKIDKSIKKKEKEDYKRFHKYKNKQIVFYSEKNGFYKYFENVIKYILKRTDIVIHYVTSDPNDTVFALQSDNFRVYYIGEKKLIVLMMRLEADMVVMTMPDLQKYHIKRSMVKENIEYVYMDHGIGSINMMLRKHALDYFDTVFASNEIVVNELRSQEECYNLKPKTIVEYGFGLIDNMILAYQSKSIVNNDTPVVLIAPSWQEDNLIDLCMDELLNYILGQGYKVILRPHPQYVKNKKEKLDILQNKYSSYNDFVLQNDFSSNDTVYNADILITDWSGIAYEYAFTTLKPVVFINTPMKVMNPDYEEINVIPFDIEIRDKIGVNIEMNRLEDINGEILNLLNSDEYSIEEMRKIREKYLFNILNSTKIGGDYIIKQLVKYSKE